MCFVFVFLVFCFFSAPLYAEYTDPQTSTRLIDTYVVDYGLTKNNHLFTVENVGFLDASTLTISNNDELGAAQNIYYERGYFNLSKDIGSVRYVTRYNDAQYLIDDFARESLDSIGYCPDPDIPPFGAFVVDVYPPTSYYCNGYYSPNSYVNLGISSYSLVNFPLSDVVIKTDPVFEHEVKPAYFLHTGRHKLSGSYIDTFSTCPPFDSECIQRNYWRSSEYDLHSFISLAPPPTRSFYLILHSDIRLASNNLGTTAKSLIDPDYSNYTTPFFNGYTSDPSAIRVPFSHSSFPHNFVSSVWVRVTTTVLTPNSGNRKYHTHYFPKLNFYPLAFSHNVSTKRVTQSGTVEHVVFVPALGKQGDVIEEIRVSYELDGKMLYDLLAFSSSNISTPYDYTELTAYVTRIEMIPVTAPVEWVYVWDFDLLNSIKSKFSIRFNTFVEFAKSKFSFSVPSSCSGSPVFFYSVNGRDCSFDFSSDFGPSLLSAFGWLLNGLCAYFSLLRIIKQ